MPRTFRAAFDKRTGQIRDSWINDDGAWVVWADPLRTRDEATGKISTSMGGPFVVLVGFWDDQKQLAEKIAALCMEANL